MHVTLPQLRPVLLITLHPPTHWDRSGLPRAVPIHRWRSRQCHADAAPPHIQIRLRAESWCRLRQSYSTQPDARHLPGGHVASLFPRARVRGVPDREPPTRRQTRHGVCCQPWTGELFEYVEACSVSRVASWWRWSSSVLGPLLLLAKFAVTPTQDILRTPLAFFPNGVAWENLHAAWFDVAYRSLLRQYSRHRCRIMGGADHHRHHRGLCLIDPAPSICQIAQCCCPWHLVHPRRCPAGSLVSDDPRPTGPAGVVAQHILGDLASCSCHRLQCRARETLLRQPANRNTRGCPGRRGRPVPALLVPSFSP